MNDAVRQYVSTVVERHPQTGKAVIELGSCDVNGNVRDLFSSAANYIGIDQREGPNVDHVCNAHDADTLGQAVDTVLCLEMLEHDTDPLATMAAAFTVLVHGGLFICTTRGIGYGLHDEPEDYWRFTHHGLRLLMEQAGFQVVESINHPESKGVFGYGFRRE